MDGRVLDSLRDAVLVGFGHLDTNLALTPLEWAVGSLWGMSYLVTHVWKLPRSEAAWRRMFSHIKETFIQSILSVISKLRTDTDFC